MSHVIFLSCLLTTASMGERERARSTLSSQIGEDTQEFRVETQVEAQAEQTQGSSIWILVAAAGGMHGSGGSVYYEPPDQGCAALNNTTYPAICSGMSGNGWECEPRTLDADGTQVQTKNPNVNNVFCPTYVSCSCKKVGHSGEYTREMCGDLLAVTPTRPSLVDHGAFLQPVEQEICPVFREACEEDCDSSWAPGKCKEEKCTLVSCLDDFPRYTTEMMRPYSARKDVGCWGRLKGNGKLGKTVLRSIAEYKSLAKCCYRQETEDGLNKFKWMSGNELAKSWRPSKWLSGRKACKDKEGWHSANNLGLDGSTQTKCESLQ